MNDFHHVPADSAWALLKPPARVTMLTFDFAVTLVFDNGAEIVLETPFALSTVNGSWTVDPEDGGGALAPVLQLLHRDVSTAIATDAGHLTVTFENGDRLEAAPSEDYEAWNAHAPDGSRLVCMPGGELAVWGPAQ